MGENCRAWIPEDPPMGESKTDWCGGESKTKGSALMTGRGGAGIGTGLGPGRGAGMAAASGEELEELRMAGPGLLLTPPPEVTAAGDDDA